MLLVAMALPAAIVLFDNLTWMRHASFDSSHARAWFFYLWLVAKTALLAWCAGWFLGASFYGWLVFIWCQALLDVHTTLGTYRLGNTEVAGLAFTLISAQIGFLALWGILGKTAWGWRLTCILLAATGVIAQVATLRDDWVFEGLPTAQALSAAILVVVCYALRASGFQLQSPPRGVPGIQANQRELVQFGIKHMLLWAAALAPLMMMIRGIDGSTVKQLAIADVRPAVGMSLSMALVLLAAIWLGVGQGQTALRLAVAALTILAAGALMYFQSIELRATYGEWPEQQMIRLCVAMGRLWFAWFALTGALLAAMLLFLRAPGYRLAKVRKPTAA